MNFVIIGAGAWGTAFSIHLSRLGHAVTLVPRRFEQALALATTRENTDYLPAIPLPPGLQIAHEPAPALMEAQVILLACPAQALRATCARLAPHLAQTRRATCAPPAAHTTAPAAVPSAPHAAPSAEHNAPHAKPPAPAAAHTAPPAPPAPAARPPRIINLAKGLELGTHLRPLEIIETMLPGRAAATLTGPTNAAEVARGLPSAMVLATPRIDDATAALQAALSGPSLRVYTTTDAAGAEYGACLKNIYAITAGCCDGLRLGDNARAALLTRALAEMLRVGQALGARPGTFYGLSGFGDLVATCHGDWSRNRRLGIQIGEGRSVAELLEGRKTVVEGYKTTAAFAELCAIRKIDAPILRETHAILYEGKPPAAALADLMARELKHESS